MGSLPLYSPLYKLGDEPEPVVVCDVVDLVVTGLVEVGVGALIEHVQKYSGPLSDREEGCCYNIFVTILTLRIYCFNVKKMQ